MSDPFRFDASRYGPVLAEWLAPPRLSELGPGKPVVAVRDRLRAFHPAGDLGIAVVDATAARTLHAGLWLYFDFLDESHDVSQDISSAEGSFWHAIMHRREPDAGNSKYSWRKVGPHPVLKSLAEHAPAVGYDYTNSLDFVDFCERVRGSGSAEEEVAKRVQLLEWQLLFDHCYRKAVG